MGHYRALNLFSVMTAINLIRGKLELMSLNQRRNLYYSARLMGKLISENRLTGLVF